MKDDDRLQNVNIVLASRMYFARTSFVITIIRNTVYVGVPDAQLDNVVLVPRDPTRSYMHSSIQNKLQDIEKKHAKCVIVAC